MTVYVAASGQSYNGLVLNNGDYLEVKAGGSATNTTVNSGAYVINEGTTLGTNLAGGFEQVQDGGITNNANVSASGGFIHAESGGTVNGATINDGFLAVDSGATSNQVTVNNSGSYIVVDGTANKIVLNNGTMETVRNGGSTVNTTVNPGATLFVEQGASEVNTTNNGGTVIDQNMACFASGTAIRTARGDIAVEHLSVGDLAITASGASRPIRWIGRADVDCRASETPEALWPVRIAVDAFGPGRPERDLLVSPGHALCVDVLGHVLVPASALIDGATVAQVEVDRVTYWHVELDTHDVLLAEGLPAESYVDVGNRGAFPSGIGSVDPARPLSSLADYCHPFHAEGPIVEALRARLGDRARTLGWTCDATLDADLHLVVDGTPVRPDIADDKVRFLVPADARDVWLASHSFVPALAGQGRDGRRLGLKVFGVSVDDGLETCRTFAADDALLCVGFHPPERHEARCFRWTTGMARIPAALWDGCRGSFFLKLDLPTRRHPAWTAPAAIEGAPRTAPASRPALRVVAAA